MVNGSTQSGKFVKQGPRRVLALRDNDEAALARASSGGAFGVLARPVLAAGGVVFGAALDDDGAVRHIAVEDAEGLERLQGSKYVQSDTRGVYAQVADVLAEGRRALFSGTPCQCAALVAYLTSKGVMSSLETAGNLIVCDLICHGTPRQDLFRAHQEWLATRLRADDGAVHGYRFRSKRQGWGLYYYYYYYYRGGRRHEVCEESVNDPYYWAFLKGLTYRPSCYRCAFATPERVSDFTIGDYWGIERAHPGFSDPRGVSLVLVNTAKAERYFDCTCATSCVWLASTFELASAENSNLLRPTIKPAGSDRLQVKVERCLDTSDHQRLFERVLRPPFSIKNAAKRALPSSALAALRRVKKTLRGGGAQELGSLHPAVSRRLAPRAWALLPLPEGSAA